MPPLPLKYTLLISLSLLTSACSSNKSLVETHDSTGDLKAQFVLYKSLITTHSYVKKDENINDYELLHIGEYAEGTRVYRDKRNGDCLEETLTLDALEKNGNGVLMPTYTTMQQRIQCPSLYQESDKWYQNTSKEEG